jgi:hypothetical protein
MNRAERISRDAEQLAFEFRSGVEDSGREPSKSEVTLYNLAALVSELALVVSVTDAIRKAEQKEGVKLDGTNLAMVS